MAVFLVDFEFREKARALLTRREIYFAIFLAIFAMLSWSEVVNFLRKSRLSSDRLPLQPNVYVLHVHDQI